MENSFMIYCHIAPNNKRYVGITSTDGNSRWRSGSGYGHNKHFQSAINKYGWGNFQHIIIADNLSKEWACKLEILLIQAWKSQNPKYGYNVLSGGNVSRLGQPHTDETRRKISEANKGKTLSAATRQKLSESAIGRTLTDETRAKLSNIQRNLPEDVKARKSLAISNALTGRKQSPEHIEKRRLSRLGKKRGPLTDEWRTAVSAGLQGRVWVTNDVENHFIKQESLQTYIDMGYRRGKIHYKGDLSAIEEKFGKLQE